MRESNTTLVNVTDVESDEFDVYIGRQNPHYNLPQSPHRNPFTVDNHGRIGAIENYKPYFFYNYLSDEDYQDQVHELTGQTLACWCTPKACHGEIIQDLLDAYVRGGKKEVKQHIVDEFLAMDSRTLSPLGVEYRARAEEILGFEPGFSSRTALEYTPFEEQETE